MLALLREEQRHHAVAVVGIARRAEEQIHRLALAYFDYARRRVVSGMTAVELVAFVNEHGGERFRRVADRHERGHEVRDIVALPTEVESRSDSRVRAAVAHRNENITLLKLYLRLENALSADAELRLRIFERFAVAYHYNVRIVVLYYLGSLVVYEMYDGEGRIGDSAHRAYR